MFVVSNNCCNVQTVQTKRTHNIHHVCDHKYVKWVEHVAPCGCVNAIKPTRVRLSFVLMVRNNPCAAELTVVVVFFNDSDVFSSAWSVIVCVTWGFMSVHCAFTLHFSAWAFTNLCSVVTLRLVHPFVSLARGTRAPHRNRDPMRCVIAQNSEHTKRSLIAIVSRYA